jgi:hypothetical protein
MNQGSRNSLLMMCALLLSVACLAQPRLTARGYLKDLVSVAPDSAGNWQGRELLHHRLNLSLRIDSNWTAALELRNRVLIGDGVSRQPGLAASLDPVGTLAPLSLHAQTQDILLHIVPDRAWVQYSRGNWQARAGRQRVNWGMNYLWNPLDWFNSWAYFDFDYEEQPSSDALRVTRFLPSDGRLDGAVKFTSDMRESVAAARWVMVRKNSTLQVQAGKAGRSAAAGLGWTQPLKQWALRAEAAGFLPLTTQDSAAVSATVSMERSISSKSTFYGAVLYNSSSPWRIADGELTLLRTTSRSLSPIAATAFVRGTYTPSPLTELSLGVFVGPVDGTLLAVPSFNVSLSDRWELMLLSQMAWGDRGAGYVGIYQAHFLRLKWSY